MPREQRHEEVGDGRAEQAAGDDSGTDRLLQPVAKHERQHHANRGGAPVDLSGHGVIRLRTPAPLVDARAQKPSAGVVEKCRHKLESEGDLEAGEIGTSGPIDAGGNRPQRARQASSMGFGREGAICEYIEIMQIPPRFERRSAAYKGIIGVLQYGGADVPERHWRLRHRIAGASRFLNSRRSSHKLTPACSVVVAIDRYQTSSMRKS